MTDAEEIRALLKKHSLPEGYAIASAAVYPQGKIDRYTKKRYTKSMQILNEATYDCPRGIGTTWEECLLGAIANAGGDDGLSATIRNALQGSKH